MSIDKTKTSSLQKEQMKANFCQSKFSKQVELMKN